MPLTTPQIIERTQVALAYLEDGARETGLVKLVLLAEETRDEVEALAAAEVVGGFIRHNRDPGDEDQQALQEELDAARQARSRRI